MDQWTNEWTDDEWTDDEWTNDEWTNEWTKRTSETWPCRDDQHEEREIMRPRFFGTDQQRSPILVKGYSLVFLVRVAKVPVHSVATVTYIHSATFLAAAALLDSHLCIMIRVGLSPPGSCDFSSPLKTKRFIYYRTNQ